MPGRMSDMEYGIPPTVTKSNTKAKATKILRATQCALNVMLMVVSVITALAAAIARWTDLLEFDGQPIIGSEREISSILHETIFQELMVAVFISSVVVLFIAILGISGSYITTPTGGDSRPKPGVPHNSASGHAAGKDVDAKNQAVMRVFRVVYAVIVSITVLMEGIVACILTWFYVWHNVGSVETTQCPYSDFAESDYVDMLSCPIDYAIKAYILDYPPLWSNLQDVWYMCGYFCGSNDFCSGKDASSQWQTTGRFCTHDIPSNATQGIFSTYTGTNAFVIGQPSTQPLRPTIFNFIGSITLPTTVFFWLVFVVSALLLANTCLIGKQQAEQQQQQRTVSSPTLHRQQQHHHVSRRRQYRLRNCARARPTTNPRELHSSAE